MILYDHPASGNCMKARILLRQLDIPFERVTVDLFTGETRTPEHFGRNPDGRIPVLELDDGQTIPESGAILAHLAEGTEFLPTDRLARARVLQWMFFEQNRIEAELAYARFLNLSGRAEQIPEVFENRKTRGGDGTAASVTVGENAAAVADSVRLAATWVRENAADLVDGDPEVTVGEVRVRAESD